MDFVDRLLTCADCRQNFIFTAGEQLFFFDKQFKNDPKRCKPCKSRRSAGVVSPEGIPAAAGISRTETRTICSECGIETTVPFKPTQGRPVLCRQCFQSKRAPTALPVTTPALPVADPVLSTTTMLTAIPALLNDTPLATATQALPSLQTAITGTLPTPTETIPGTNLEPIPIPVLSTDQATAELVAAASSTAAIEHAPGLTEAIAAAIEVPQA